MKQIDAIATKIYTLPTLMSAVNGWRLKGQTISFTNGCFDILHEGHIFSLSQAAREADLLIVGVNSDASTKRLKGGKEVNREKRRDQVKKKLTRVEDKLKQLRDKAESEGKL